MFFSLPPQPIYFLLVRAHDGRPITLTFALVGHSPVHWLGQAVPVITVRPFRELLDVDASIFAHALVFDFDFTPWIPTLSFVFYIRVLFPGCLVFLYVVMRITNVVAQRARLLACCC